MKLLRWFRSYILVVEDLKYFMCIGCCCLWVWLDVVVDYCIHVSMRNCTSYKVMKSGGGGYRCFKGFLFFFIFVIDAATFTGSFS